MHNPDKGNIMLPANILFFPAASLYAALIVPFSLAVMLAIKLPRRFQAAKKWRNR